jgi:beta-lactamase class D
MSPTAALLALTLTSPATEPFAEAPALDAVFADHESCFVLLEPGPRRLRVHGGSCHERSTPASTFKVPHALIALETGVVPDASFTLAWDGRTRRIRSWNRDHDLRSALADSVLWYFQETARRIGAERMAGGVRRLGYGNADTSSGTDTFWLGGSLEVSPIEQVEFLDRLRRGALPVSDRAQSTVRELLVVGERGGAVLRGKSGTHLDPDLGWFVGWLERDGRAFVFATRIRGEGARGYSTARRMSEEALALLGLWPEGP